MKYRFSMTPSAVVQWTVEVAPFGVSITRGRKRGAQKFYSFYCPDSKVQYDYHVVEKGETGVSKLAWGRASVETHYHVRNMLPSAVPLARSKRPKGKARLVPGDDGNQQKRLM